MSLPAVRPACVAGDTAGDAGPATNGRHGTAGERGIVNDTQVNAGEIS